MEVLIMPARFRLVILAVGLTGLPAPSWAQAEDERTRVGPAGGEGGTEFTDEAPPRGARVVGVRVRHGRWIDGIELIDKTADGQEQGLGWHGGEGGEEETFRLEEGEYITGITGKAGTYIDSLRIVTNRRTSKTYGGDGGDNTFDLRSSSREVAGFFGRSGPYLDQIGILVRKSSPSAGQTG
jgi:hypothetical protein